MKKLRSVLAYDTEWTSPDLTEQHALLQANKLLPEVPEVLYLGFPWATLIERLNSKESSADSLHKVLYDMNLLFKEQKYVVTVCQHVDMLKHQALFEECGVTHVFWVHAVKGQSCFPKNEQIKILPFPILPAQVTACAWSSDLNKNYLYSFIEPKFKNRTLSKTSGMIFTNLSGMRDGLVIPCDKYDFNEVFHSTGFHGGANSNQVVMDYAAPVEFVRILQESIFSLCPAGEGSNSMRLWQSIGCGSIPVVLSDNYLPPGSNALWELATVSCPERLEDILALPDRLATIVSDKELLEQKRHAMRQLWMLYGPDCFIYDIQKLFLSFAGETADIVISQPTLSYDRLYSMATEINRTKTVDSSVADVFILGCSSRVLSDPSGFLARYRGNIDFRNAYKQAFRSCSLGHAESMVKALEFKKIVLDHIPSR